MAKKSEKPKEEKPSKYDEKLIVNSTFEEFFNVVKKDRDKRIEKGIDKKKTKKN